MKLEPEIMKVPAAREFPAHAARRRLIYRRPAKLIPRP
jgi:hypothetical protein